MNEPNYPPLKIYCTMIDLTNGDKREREVDIPLSLSSEPNEYIVIPAYGRAINTPSLEL